ncbi:DUF1131 family protein [Ruegeria sp. R14_0]|uniref:DUF1131 family protein n=1 Tax=Ruegeria sp. R14_0 TaxID=2821100 RepID=UPI001ADAC0BC|nr:DUF1131 family protein [Ruegeria sp. R14_0]MBO9448217.1 DUF1131 family protein [Ruegeria sp. R14_0]
MAFRFDHLALTLSAVFILSPIATRAEDALRLGINGLGEITAATPFDVQTLNSVMPSHAWRLETQATEEGTQEVILTTMHGVPAVALIRNGRGGIGAIEVTSGQIGNWLGPRVGDAFGPLQENFQLAGCTPGSEARSGSVLCVAAETDVITYVFSGRWQGPDGQMPPPSVLNGWGMTQMIWKVDGAVPLQQPTPSFDCTAAEGSVESLICSDAELAGLDRRLSTLYTQKIAASSAVYEATLRAVQRGWIKGRNDCWKSSQPRQCVIDAYTDRIAALNMDDISPTLEGTTWQGLHIAGDAIPRPIDINLTFGPDGQLSGSSGCNRLVATYAVEGGTLRIGRIGSTRRLCPELEMLAEQRFLAALENVNGWAIRNGQLVLFGSGAELTFEHG